MRRWLLLVSALLLTAVTSSRKHSDDAERLVGLPAYGNYSTPLVERMRGIAYTGDASRLRLLVNRMLAGEAVRVATLGGSITYGQGVHREAVWPVTFTKWLQHAYPTSQRNHSLHNGAVPGVTSSYMNACADLHLHSDADLVLLEFSVNDGIGPDSDFHSPNRRSLERLIRKALQLPSRPAVVMVHMFCYRQGQPCCRFWNNAERDYAELGMYYSLPSVSLKAALYHMMQLNTTGFTFADIYGDGMNHPLIRGHTVTTELLATLLERLAAETRAGLNPLPQDLMAAAAAAPLPAPMVPGNFEAQHSLCFVDTRFQSRVTVSQGWNWTDEHRGQFKYGFVADKVGSTLRFHISTMASAVAHESPIATATHVVVQLAYLASYVGMGMASVSCTEGCKCSNTTIDAHNDRSKTSVTLVKDIPATQAANCTMELVVANQTRSGQHKFKVLGVIVSEEEGAARGPIDEFLRGASATAAGLGESVVAVVG